MPKPVIAATSPAYETLQAQTENLVKPKPKLTKVMVQEAMITLHSVKGVTLKQIYKHIADTHSLQLITKIRAGLIKTYLKSLWESADIVNITGKGLSGRFKLVNKKRFEREITKRQFIAKAKVTENSKKRQPDHLAHILPVIPRQVTPQVHLSQITSSIFDTPLVAARAHASTPFIGSLITRAPQTRKHKEHMKTPTDDEIGTPRSSLTKKKRKLHK